jgi:3-deoxy-D-arabino-heptulosonate 7-phosphate (DAHP) synthase
MSKATDEQLPELGVLRSGWPEYADPSTTHSVTVRGVEIGGPNPVVIAGPCAVESFEQTLAVAHAVRAAGAQLMRGGAFKPRTNPHSFQGLGLIGLEILDEVRRLTGLGIVTEVLDPRLVDLDLRRAGALHPLLDEGNPIAPGLVSERIRNIRK